MKNRLVRVGVVMTALLCLGAAALASRTWFNNRCLAELCQDPILRHNFWRNRNSIEDIMASWRGIPCYGWDEVDFRIFPSFYPELLRRRTGLNLPDNRHVWEMWLAKHPNEAAQDINLDWKPEPTP